MSEINENIFQDEARVLINKLPSRVIRYGIALVFASILILLLLAYVIQYPDIVRGEITISRNVPHAPVVAQQNGQLTELFVANKQKVEKSQILAVIENAANFKEMMAVEKQFRAFYQSLIQTDSVPNINFKASSNLGEIQSFYIDLIKTYQEYQFNHQHSFFVQKTRDIKSQINSQQTLYTQTEKQSNLLQEKFKLTLQKFRSDSLLYDNKVIAQLEFNTSKKAMLDEKYQLQQISNNLTNIRILIQELNKELTLLDESQSNKSNDVFQKLKQSCMNFDAALSNWEKLYVLKAPCDGVVSFYNYWAKNQTVTTGTEVMTVIPNATGIFGIIYLSPDRYGKIKLGQNVNIKLYDYPFEEYGALKGQVNLKSEIARSGKYMITISLDQTTTTYHKKINITQEMKGGAEIIIEDLRVIDRIFYLYRRIRNE